MCGSIKGERNDRSSEHVPTVRSKAESEIFYFGRCHFKLQCKHEFLNMSLVERVYFAHMGPLPSNRTVLSIFNYKISWHRP